jgi:hypothetical protein
MNVNDLYQTIPEDQHGNIAVSEGAVTITQEKQAPVVLLKKTTDDNADLTDTAGKQADRAHLESKITTLKSVAAVNAAKMI